MVDVISLVLNAAGEVLRVAVGQPEDIPVESGETAILRDGAAAEAWIGFVRTQDGSFALPVPPVVPPTKVDLIVYASDARWRREVSGTTWNGFPVATDDRSKTLVNGELSAIDLSVRQDGEYFKFADGLPRPLSNVDMQAVAIAMRAHVKFTFALLFEAQAGIQAGTISTTAQVDSVLARSA